MRDDTELIRRNPLAQRRTDRKCQDFLPPGAAHLSRFRPGVAQTCAKQPKAQSAPAVTSRRLAGLSSRASRFCLKPERGEVASQPEPSHPFVLVLCAANSCREPGLPTRRAFNTPRLQHASLHPFQSPPLLAFSGKPSFPPPPPPPFSLPATWLDFRGAPGWGELEKNNIQDVAGWGGGEAGGEEWLQKSFGF